MNIGILLVACIGVFIFLFGIVLPILEAFSKDKPDYSKATNRKILW